MVSITPLRTRNGVTDTKRLSVIITESCLMVSITPLRLPVVDTIRNL